MNADFVDAGVAAVKHYLSQIDHVLEKLRLEARAGDMLATRLAPDMFDTGLNFAIAIGFAARALCPPAGLDVPQLPDDHSVEALKTYADAVARRIAPISADSVLRPVTHVAGLARLEQDPADYVLRFALPNMIFHLTLAHAGLRHAGLQIGKADFDGLHVY